MSMLESAIIEKKSIEVVMKECGKVAIGFIVVDFVDVVDMAKANINNKEDLSCHLEATVEATRDMLDCLELDVEF